MLGQAIGTFLSLGGRITPDVAAAVHGLIAAPDFSSAGRPDLALARIGGGIVAGRAEASAGWSKVVDWHNQAAAASAVAGPDAARGDGWAGAVAKINLRAG